MIERSRVPSSSSWLFRGIAAVLLLVVYVTLWQPVRTALVQHVARPVLAAAPAAASETVRDQQSGPRHLFLRLTTTDGETTAFTIQAPAGVQFLVPALFLVVLAPGRGYWIGLWAGHIVLFGIILVALFATLSGSTPLDHLGYRLAHFTQAYLVDLFSLIVPVGALIRERKGGLKAALES